ncbi:MAG: PEP-CTERM/exosortase system-associated acyltransferase [Alphaproteobacteria bacterium]|nr:PEP-CTERM/exosortase system-associated acyltransferase [Alphaproteobacteria bacterium]
MPNSVISLWRQQAERPPASALEQAYKRHFRTVVADTPALQDIAHRLRYRIYCLENQGYENPEQHLDGRESDDYDHRSIHTLVQHKDSGDYIGVIRVVLPDKTAAAADFPFQRIIDSPRIHHMAAGRDYCEISRLGIVQDFRSHSNGAYKNHIEGLPISSYVMLGLVHGALRTSLENKVRNAFFIVEPKLVRALSIMGLSKHEVLGEPVDYHGLRQPFAFNYLENFRALQDHNRSLWSFITDHGTLHKLALRIEYPAQGRPQTYRLAGN